MVGVGKELKKYGGVDGSIRVSRICTLGEAVRGGYLHWGRVGGRGKLILQKMVGHLKGVTKRVEQGKRRYEAFVIRCLQAKRID